MTVDDVRAEVERIRDLAGDDESAHSAEDRLHQDVLRAISDGAPNAAELAAEVLKTEAIQFARWCA